MSLSDILTILGLIAAIIAFVSEKNRENLFLKFSIFDLLIFILSFMLIHYLIAFDWFKERNWHFEFLNSSNFPTPATWAYLMTLATLAYLFYKTYFSFFPTQNRERVIAYYRSQVLKGEFSFLVSLIEKFHQQDIVAHLKDDKTVNANRHTYANNVYWEIITDETFLDNTVITHPYLYTDFIACLSTKKLGDEDFIFRYLSILIENNNYHLIRELKNNQNFSEHKRYKLPVENRILRSLFLNVRVAEYNNAWQPYGKLTCKYLEEESEKKFSFLRTKYKGEDEKEMWQLRIYQAIWFFDIMLREAIAQGVERHMWLFYFHHFTDGLIENIPDDNKDSTDDNIPTKNHYLIHEMISIMCSWIELTREMNKSNQYHSISKCIGQCLLSIALTPKVSDKFKGYCFESAFREYFHLSEREETDEKMAAMEQYFYTPKMGFHTPHHESEKAEYVRVMTLAWDDFDKVPYQNHEDNGSIQRFQENVLTPLRIIN